MVLNPCRGLCCGLLELHPTQTIRILSKNSADLDPSAGSGRKVFSLWFGCRAPGSTGRVANGKGRHLQAGRSM